MFNKYLDRLALRWFDLLRNNGLLAIGEIKIARIFLGRRRLEMALNRTYQKFDPPTYLDELRVIVGAIR